MIKSLNEPDTPSDDPTSTLPVPPHVPPPKAEEPPPDDKPIGKRHK